MAAETQDQIVLYDLACNQGICFSPAVWRIRLMLNYKQLAYKTVFLEFPDIEPTLKDLQVFAPCKNAHALLFAPAHGNSGVVPNEGAKHRYTVPTIHHVATNKYIMDSVNIAQFLEATYPDPPLPLTSELGRQIEVKARAVVGKAFRVSVEPRELNVISPRAQEYFRHGREAALGHSLEALLDTEEAVWKEVEGDAQAVGELMRTNKADGPFVLGKEPSMTDFFIAGALQNARVVHESVFEKMMKYPGYGEIYQACLPWMEKKD